MSVEIHNMDCRVAMSLLMEPDSIDSIVCDPPYGLSAEPDASEVLRHWLAGDDYTHSRSGFMGKSWDSFVPGPAVWREAYRVLKPGGYLLAFFGTRTYDLGVMAIRLAGFEIRDEIAWIYGSGFPKSMDVSKAIDKAAGAEGTYGAPKSAAHAGWIDRGRMRGDEGHEGYQRPWMTDSEAVDRNARQYEGASDASRRWAGWGTALKPAHEPIVVARKPLSERTVSANVLRHGTGGINIDACRVGTEGGGTHCGNRDATGRCLGHNNAGRSTSGETFHGPDTAGGRFPANVAHDGSDEVLAGFPPSGPGQIGGNNDPNGSMGYHGERDAGGSAARFFYQAKASKADRDEGLAAFVPGARPTMGSGIGGQPNQTVATNRNVHPTVKPTPLMQWLVRMVTPPGGIVLDPFMGSGSTGKAAALEGFSFVGCELDPEYAAIAAARIDAAVTKRYATQP